ncbi:putative transmembrane protein [Toxoplasma gondii p89]|uniref:Putative transmembrane protein n=1 Tax=Toxoplasma gondii p89 TaxID=943119 RepID=A0A086KAC4_TOXGO|nr:putative transmembrane protein [Toxoplasma gondii p89]
MSVNVEARVFSFFLFFRSQYRAWWWQNPLGMGLVLYGTYKAWHMIYMVRKQKKTAQLVAAAYGQGGQWLNPVPR